jgi:hypothetical protein
MKRFFTLLGICLAAVSLIGCGNDYEKKARVWVCDQVDHFACPDANRHALYFLEHTTSWGRTYFEKVDLDDMSVQRVCSISCTDNSTYNFGSILGYGLPEDKGYGGSESFIVVVDDNDQPTDEQQAAVIYNTNDNIHKKICHGQFVKAHGYSLVSRCHINGGSISGVDVFDVEGNKLETKAYAGTIARQNVIAEIVVKDGYFAGSYYYTKYGPGKHRLYIYGKLNSDNVFEVEGENINSYGGNLFNCEDWEVAIKDGKIAGEAIIHHTGRTYEFVLTEVK